MKTLSLFAVLIFGIFSSNTSIAQSVKTETIKVWGNCGMCKTKIEKAAKTAGAKTASWDEDTKELKVSYAVNKTSSTKIQEEIAKTGYDTQDFTAPDAVYSKLHGCCQYDRKSSDASNVKCCDHADCGKTADCCKGMDCCKGKTCAKVDGTAKACCTEDGCKKDAAHCKEANCCKDKACCKS